MRRRPQPSVRRGLLRAAAAVVGLTIVLLALILVISTLTAPKAKAPTVPPTPTIGTPQATPSRTGTVGTPTKKTAVATSGAKKKKSSMRSGASLAHRVLSARGSMHAVASPNGHFLLSFRPSVDAYARTPLVLTDKATGRERTVGYGDALVRPVWSPDSSAFLYVRVSPTKSFPGARWTVIRGTRSGPSSALAHALALSVLPLGWSGGRPLYIATTASDTSIYSAAPGHVSFISILFPQAVTGASLSPDGRTIAFAVPTGCGYCSVDLFHLGTLKTTYGPSGWGSQWNLAWTPDSHALVTSGIRTLAIVNVADGTVRHALLPRTLGRVWPHTMRASLSGGVRLTDTVSGARFISGR